MINMYQNHNGHPKRRKKRPIHGTKTVEVTRGKSGYGFTISGQHPCVLSCIVNGSPAELAGLKPGDYLMGVNTEDVSKAPHDDVVRMVGLSTGKLTLQVAENYNSSDSSDDDYHQRTKSRYPNRVRPRHVSGTTRQVEKNSVERYVPEGRSRNQSQLIRHSASQSKVRSHTPVGAENMDLQTSQKSSHSSNGSASLAQRRTLSVPHSVALSPDAQHKPKQALIKSTSQGGKSRHEASVKKHQQSSLRNSNYLEGFSPSNVSQIVMSSLYHQNSADNAFIAMNDDDCDCSYRDDEDESELIVNGTSIRVIVGYIGSIEMPSSANLPNVRLQSIRNAVRRLRVEQKIHTLVLMEVSHHGVKLTNAMGSTIAHYPVDKLAFSGVCPDDKRFFGIVTLHSSGGDGSSENGSQDEYATSSSCHVFMVDPELYPHNVHAQKAKSFSINCTPFNNRCLEFPRSTTPIILSITNLYKDHPGGQVDNDITRSQIFANPAQLPLRSNSTTSNSDSGLGFGRDDRTERADMPAAHGRLNNNRNCHVTDEPVSQSSHDSFHDSFHHLSPGIQLMPTPRNSKFNASIAQISLNMSTSSEEFPPCLSSDKLNVRAMPDPVQFAETPSPEKANPNLIRKSTHKLMQARQRHASEHFANSDQESQTSSKSDTWKSSSFPNLQRPISAPFGKLLEIDFTQPGLENKPEEEFDKKPKSPVSLPSAFKQIRSPSAPPITLNHSLNSSSTTEDDDDFDENSEPKFFEIGDGNNDMDSIIARFESDKALGISSGIRVDPRRFSEGYALSKQVSFKHFHNSSTVETK